MQIGNMTLYLEEHFLTDAIAECTVYPDLPSKCQGNREGIEIKEWTITGGKKERNHNGTPIIGSLII